MSDFREHLYTVDEHGHRQWVYSSIEKGRFFAARRLVAYLLIAFYLLMPWISINGKQGVLLDIAGRRFIFFGAEFWATDTFFLFLFFGTMAFSLFFFTAFLGRIWCGWACPETVFLEFVFRPIERLIEGSPAQRMKLDRAPWTFAKIRKKALKHFLCTFWSWIIATSTLAYFIGREPLLLMMGDWPQNHLGPFLSMLALMAVMAFQFGWFREQFCTVLCPYARFQSVLMDSNSLIVGYDIKRGEPRGKKKKVRDSGEDAKGDCIDCGLCVRVCPTGIDIRNGLQLECVSCTSCIDACDSIMQKTGRPKGLIRYDTENILLGKTKKRKILRIRPIAYGVILTLFILTFIYELSTRQLSEFQIVRGASDVPFSVLEDQRISNHLTIELSNKGEAPVTYEITALDYADSLQILAPLLSVPVKPRHQISAPLFINFPVNILKNGKLRIRLQLKGSDNFSGEESITLLGPQI